VVAGSGAKTNRIDRSPQTIRRWETEGKLQAKRLPSGHRYFDESDVRLMLGGAPKTRDVVVYCRVSSAGQIAEESGCEIVVVNQDALSPEQEMVEDLMAIIQTFSGRLSGMRNTSR